MLKRIGTALGISILCLLGAAVLAINVADFASGFIRPVEDQTIERYCNYGATSEAQRDGCLEHVTRGDVYERNTQAARYAREELSQCLGESGPYCKDTDNTDNGWGSDEGDWGP